MSTSRIFAGDLRIFPGQAADDDAPTALAAAPQPIYLLADSQLLFWRDAGMLFLDSLRLRIPRTRPSAAYLGASNGDLPAFYSIFTAAMEGIGITRCRMIRTEMVPDDREFLRQADLILLAGGDVQRGWDAFGETGARELVLQRQREGAVLVGVSAGAVQLGLLGWPEDDVSPGALFGTFGLVPFAVDAHDEGREWPHLREVVRAREGSVTGIGIPTGGGLVYHPEGVVEAIRHPLHELVWREGEVVRNVILPAEERQA